MRRVGDPDEQAVPAGRTPAEEAGQLLPAHQVRYRPSGPIVRHGQVLDACRAERVDETHDGTGHIGLHGRGEGDAVLLAHVVGQAQQFVQLVGGTGLGVEVERHRGEFDPALAHPLDELLHLFRRACVRPLLEGPQGLDAPAELGLGRPVVGGLGELQARVEEREVFGEHPALRVGVADVQVRVVHQVDGPLALRGERHVDPVAARPFRQGQRDPLRRVDGGQQQPDGAARPGDALGGQQRAGGGAHGEVGRYRGAVHRLHPEGLQQATPFRPAHQRLGGQPQRGPAQAAFRADDGAAQALANPVVVPVGGTDEGPCGHADISKSGESRSGWGAWVQRALAVTPRRNRPRNVRKTTSVGSETISAPARMTGGPEEA